MNAVTADSPVSGSASEKPLVYFVLGSNGSGRHAVIQDLAAAADEEGERTALLDLANTWPDWPSGVQGATRLFLIADGRRSPVDQVEALKPWLETHGAELGRILCVINCELVAKTPSLLPWFDACVHFSDAVLLNRREGVSNKWISDFQKRYADQFYPCLFEFVKKGRVSNPLIVLEPQARRISQYFDPQENSAVDGLIIENDNAGIEVDEGDGDENVTPEDPYLARNAGGRRLKELPDIEKYL